jgi:cell division protein ZapA
MADVTIQIAGRTYQVACRAGEEDNLLAAARLVDAKSREALSGLGTLSETRQLLFASLLLADQLLEKPGGAAPAIDPALAPRVHKLAERIESLAGTLEADLPVH